MSHHPQPRLHALDGLRATMMLLGLAIHAVISYGVVDYGGAWSYKDNSTTFFADLLVFFIHVFRMPVFYVMAGFFAAMLYLRRGARGLAKNRMQRILVPFLFGWVLLSPLVLGGFTFAHVAKDVSIAAGWQAFVAQAGRLELWADSTMHLWFLYDLMIFYAAALVLVPLSRRLPDAWERTVRRVFEWSITRRWRPLLFTLPTAWCIWLMGGGLRTSVSFVPDPQVLAAYGLFFAFGWLLWYERDRLDTFRRDAWIQVGIATALAPINLIMTLRAGESPGTRVLASLTGALMVWLFVFGLTGLFLRYLNRPSARVRYIVDSSYWLYLIHLPFTIWVPGLLSHLSWPAIFKIVALLAISTPFWVLSYDLLVRPTFIGKVLNGRRYPRGLPHPDTLSGGTAPAVAGRTPLADPASASTPRG